MTSASELLTAIRKNPEGPVRKFALIKTFGPALERIGVQAKRLSCDEIEQKVREHFVK